MKGQCIFFLFSIWITCLMKTKWAFVLTSKLMKHSKINNWNQIISAKHPEEVCSIFTRPSLEPRFALICLAFCKCQAELFSCLCKSFWPWCKFHVVDCPWRETNATYTITFPKHPIMFLFRNPIWIIPYFTHIMFRGKAIVLFIAVFLIAIII